LREDEFGRLEAVGFMHSYGQPDDIEEEVEHYNACGDFEDVPVGAWVEVVHADCHEEDALGDNPLHGAEFDVVRFGGEVKAEDCDFGEDEVGRGLTVCGYEGGPGGARPPCYDKTE